MPHMTIVDAFENFFGNPEWKLVSATESTDVVEFVGDAISDDYIIEVVITFTIYDDYFEIDNIKVDGVDLPLFMYVELIDRIFATDDRVY